MRANGCAAATTLRPTVLPYRFEESAIFTPTDRPISIWVRRTFFSAVRTFRRISSASIPLRTTGVLTVPSISSTRAEPHRLIRIPLGSHWRKGKFPVRPTTRIRFSVPFRSSTRATRDNFMNIGITGQFSANGRYIHGRCTDPRPSGKAVITIETNQ